MITPGDVGREAYHHLQAYLLRPTRWRPLPHQVAPPGDWRGWILAAGRGCIAAHIRIFDPLTGAHVAVSDLAAAGQPITVLGLGHDGAVPVRCEPPFLKGTAELIRFELADGSQVTVTEDHQLLTPSGWRRARDVDVGHPLGCGADLRWERVTSRQPVGAGEFYDLQVPGAHSYLAEGIWHHNSGKTDACAHYVAEHVAGPPCIPGPAPHWVGIIAPTLGDAVTSCWEGPSGLRVHAPDARLVQTSGGTVIRWKNGSVAKIFGAENPESAERLRAGGNRCLNWLEELAAWRYLDKCYEQMRFGLRLGSRPHWVASTTPKPRKLIKDLISDPPRNVVVTRATTADNPHLPEDIRAELYETYGGRRIGRQELYAEIVDQDEAALWTREQLDLYRVYEVPALLRRVTVGVDPSGGAGEQGIVVAGKTVESAVADGKVVRVAQGYTLHDASCSLDPHGWGRRAVQAAVDWEADDLVVERNFGGDMATSVLLDACDALGVVIPVRSVTASRGKRVRAEPVSALAARGRWHQVGNFPELELQMCTWSDESDYSPDRLDALVWTAWHSKLVSAQVRGQGSFGGRAMGERIT